MIKALIDRSESGTVPITPLDPDRLERWLRSRPATERTWVARTGFRARPGSHCLLPGRAGALGRVLAGIDTTATDGFYAWGGLAAALPRSATYRIDADYDAATAGRAALGWELGAYAFDRYRSRPREDGAEPGSVARLVWPKAADRAEVGRAARAVVLVRDLINTPAGDMGPAALAAAAETVAKEHGAECRIIAGDELLSAGYPAIHAVGRAAAANGPRAPRLIDLAWGRTEDSRVTLVGKGVCFDTGGLDLKTVAGMRLMKKDMGGAAHVLGLGQMIMDARLPVRLRILVPAIENSIGSGAMRPHDVLQSRKGLTVEIGNTDAEGRLVLADALAEASEERPTLLIDCATLTGAARVALGPDVPALFCNDDALVDDLLRSAEEEQDPLWRLPLWSGYRNQIIGKTADLTNAPEGGYGGAITAALFLQEFIESGISWAHIDMMAWNLTSRPGRPEGGEAMGLRALFALVAGRFGRRGGGR